MGDLFVFDFDESQRIFSNVSVRRRHGRYRGANESHWIIENETLVRVAATRPRHLRVAVMNNGFDTRQLFCLGSIDADDLRMRHRTAKNARIEHAGKLNISGILRLPGDSLITVDPWRSFADDGEFLFCLCHNDLPSASPRRARPQPRGYNCHSGRDCPTRRGAPVLRWAWNFS